MFCHELIHHNEDYITLGIGRYHVLLKLKSKVQ